MRAKMFALAVAMSSFMMAADVNAAPAVEGKPAATATTSNTVLGIREYDIASIAAYVANGNQDLLKTAMAKGLDDGLTINEIKDVLAQMYAYCGFPRALTALGTLTTLLDERKSQGISDEVGREATPLPEGTDIHKLGTKVQTALSGAPVHLAASPDLDRYLKDHLFGDIFASDLLSHKDREIATIAALSSLPAPIQLDAHYRISLNAGWTKEQLQDFVQYMQKNVGTSEGKVASDVLTKFLQQQQQ